MQKYYFMNVYNTGTRGQPVQSCSSFRFLPFLFEFAVRVLGFKFCVFVVGWRLQLFGVSGL